MYVVANNFVNDQVTKFWSNSKRCLNFLQFFEKNLAFRILVHIKNRLLKIGLPISNGNEPVCHTDICMESTKNTHCQRKKLLYNTNTSTYCLLTVNFLWEFLSCHAEPWLILIFEACFV